MQVMSVIIMSDNVAFLNSYRKVQLYNTQQGYNHLDGYADNRVARVFRPRKHHKISINKIKKQNQEIFIAKENEPYLVKYHITMNVTQSVHIRFNHSPGSAPLCTEGDADERIVSREYCTFELVHRVHVFYSTCGMCKLLI